MWLNVLSDEAYAGAKAKSPDAPKIRVGSYPDFAKLVSTSKASFDPTPTHLQENGGGRDRRWQLCVQGHEGDLLLQLTECRFIHANVAQAVLNVTSRD
jgi:hypothetical protein